MTNNENYFPILCNQEIFLTHGNRFKIQQRLPNARIYFKKAVKDSMDERAKNAYLVKLNKVGDVSPDHWRLQAIPLQAPSNRLLMIHSYFLGAAISSVMEGNEFDNIIRTGDKHADSYGDSRAS